MKRDITSDQLRIAAAQNNKEKAYWSAKFQGEIQESHFPYDFPVRDGKKTGSGTSRQEWTFDLPGEIYARLIEACKNSDPRLHMILAAGIAALLYRYLEHDDIVTGMPIYRQEGAAQFINTALALRLAFNEHITFKELLNQVRETIREAIAHQDYPVEILAESLDLEQTGNGFPLFDTALLLENIHDRQYLEHIELNMIFCCQWFKETERIKVTIQYNPDLYRQSSVAQIAAQYTLLLEQALLNLHNPEVLLTGIELLAEPEKKWLLETINATATLFPRGQSLVELFNQHVQQTPQQVAVISDLDLNPIYDILESPTEPATGSWETLKKCCFKKNPYIASYKDKGFLAALGIFTPKEIQELTMLRTHRDNYAAVDRPVLLLLEHLQGQLNLESLLRSISPQELAFRIFPTYMGLQSPSPRADRVYLKLNGTPAKLISLIKVLYKLNLIEFTGYRAEITPCEIPGEITSPARTLDEQRIDSPGCVKPKTGKNPVLLLGDRTGPASTGLLYIASFLRRNGIEAYCQWNDLNQTRAALTANIRQILDTIQPKIVGVSMKWFPHIARVLEICRQVKTYDPSILVVVGGNTASYYKEKIIQYDFIDYVIMGDGEVPFLEICQGKTLIKNSVYRQNGEIICNPVTYVQGETADGEFFLSHLEEIFVSKLDPYLTPHFYINTGKGCPQQCIYCAGCRDAQKKVFNRSKPFLRGIAEVRKDLIAALEYTRWFMYDFDLPFYGEESSRYYEQIWEGIDFSGHFCRFYFWQLPSLEFIELVVRTFKYVELNIDLCSLSEAYRLRLSALYMVKPQPTDAEILAFFDACEKYDQIAVIINLIIGLPHLTPADLEKSEQMLAYLLKNYRCFKEMDWGRLHAQPGAPIVENSHKYNMTCYAHTFEDFLHYSRLNMEEDQYPDLWTFNYPYIYFQDEEFNSQITNHYFTAQQKIQDHLKVQRRNIAAQTSLTFMELHEQSNVLAGRLKERGIGEGVLVGLYMHRSQEMITVILAILKTGAAYLPLDPNYPLERIRYMLTDSNTQLLVTTKDMANQVEKLRGWNKAVFYYPAEQNPAGFFHVTASTDHIPAAAAPAYVMYTSGSTGQPRGVVITHENVARLVKNSNYIQFTGDDRLLPTGSIGFDISTFEIWAPLLNGVLVVIADQQLLLDASQLEKILQRHKITILHLIPQLFNQFAAQNPGMFDNLRVLLVGGDLVRPPFVNEIRQRNQQLKILHMYGPTENTTFSTFLPVETNYENSIPIGRPIANSSVYILDRQKNLKPLGAVGELHVGGAGVGLGYLNQPERTAEKFDQDLWDKKDDQDKKNKSFFRGLRGAVFSKRAPLIYKTGDLARWLPGGVLEFLGRVDFQVKVRGVRIEITEIENHLLKHPGIKNIFVIAGESEEGEKYLAAYWEPKELLAHDDIDFREYLLKQLPEYMIPSYFIKIEKFPLTSHGKIDRKALPEPKSAGNTGVYNAPRDEVEKGLAQIWSEVLGMPQERIGIDMNFNRLGGHSLKATIMAAKIHKVYNVKIPLGVVFTTPYIKDLAIYIKTARKDFFTDLEPVEKKEYYDVSPAQKRVYLAHHMENDNISYNIPMLERLVLDRADMAIGENHLDLICRQLIAQHESLRTSFIQIEGKPRQKINDHVDFHIEYYDITGPGYNQTNNPAIKDIIDRFVRPFDLSLPPLLRLAIIKEDQHQLILLMDFHHIISDEFSQKILVKDFLKLLFGGQLLPLRLQYKDYSEWQNKTLKNNKKPGEEYWLKRFSGEIPQLHLPTDYPRTENTGSAGNSLEFFVAGEQTQLLLQLAGQEGTTLYMLLVAIFSILLSKIANQDDILIGTSVLGRNHADLQSITGMFVNILVLRNYPVGEKNFLDYLQEVKKNTLDAFENQEYPFEELVERVLPVRDRTRNPLFDVLFDYHELGANDMDPDFKQPDRDEAQKNGTVYYGIKHRAAKFDITWSASLLRNRLNFSVEYRTSLFEKETIENFIFYYRRIITTVLENPRQKISEISLSSRQNQDLALLAQDLEII